MKFKIVGMIAAVALIAGCETAPDGSGSASGSGAGAASQVVPGSQEDLVANVGDRVFYGFDKSNLDAEDRAVLERQAAFLKKFPSISITIAGNADERGTREYNLALGESRANSAKDYLIALGIDPNRIATISYGKERPVCVASNEACWSQNRNAITIVKGAGS